MGHVGGDGVTAFHGLGLQKKMSEGKQTLGDRIYQESDRSISVKSETLVSASSLVPFGHLLLLVMAGHISMLSF